jgi:hypothetical protein
VRKQAEILAKDKVDQATLAKEEAESKLQSKTEECDKYKGLWLIATAKLVKAE